MRDSNGILHIENKDLPDFLIGNPISMKPFVNITLIQAPIEFIELWKRLTFLIEGLAHMGTFRVEKPDLHNEAVALAQKIEQYSVS